MSLRVIKSIIHLNVNREHQECDKTGSKYSLEPLHANYVNIDNTSYIFYTKGGLLWIITDISIIYFLSFPTEDMSTRRTGQTVTQTGVPCVPNSPFCMRFGAQM